MEPTGLPHLSCPFISLAVISCPSGTTILIGAFAAGICDLVTLFGSVNASVDLLSFVNELSFELPIHIVSFEDHSGTMIIHSS